MAKAMMVMNLEDFEAIKNHLSNAWIDICNVDENSYFTSEVKRHLREALDILQKE